MSTIQGFDTHDVRFPTSLRLDGGASTQMHAGSLAEFSFPAGPAWRPATGQPA
jgi:hypothetical protein